jgi:hypothetical protein
MDDGADLVTTLLKERPTQVPIGSTEETTTGVIRLRAIVHGHLGNPVEHGPDVRVVRIGVLTPDREDGNPLGDEGGGDVVLCREGVRGAERNVRSPGPQSLHEVGGLGGHVQACRDSNSGERGLLLEPLADRGENWHPPASPFDAKCARLGQRGVGDIVVHGREVIARVSRSAVAVVAARYRPPATGKRREGKRATRCPLPAAGKSGKERDLRIRVLAGSG